MARSALSHRLARLLRLAIEVEAGRLDEATARTVLAARQSGEGLPKELVELSRRRFARVAGAGFATLAAWPLLRAGRAVAGAAALSSRDAGRVVIVGGGVAGLTAAYRLVQAGIQCSVYEASARLGGRMFTARNFNAEGMFCERGGELVDTQHADLIALCGELGIPIQEIRNAPGNVSAELYYSHGALRSEADVVAAFAPLAKCLNRDLAALTVSGNVTTPTYNAPLAQVPAVQALDRMTLAAYLAKAGIDAWLNDLITIAYVGEYGLEADRQSALNLLLQIGASTDNGFAMLGTSDESKRVGGGSDTLPRVLAEKIKDHASIVLGAWLLAVRDTGTELRLTFQQGGRHVDVVADRLVLALPAPLLREVDFAGVALSPVKTRAIQEWGFGTNVKFMLGFNKRVWNKTGSGGFILYTDTPGQEFWDTSRAQTGTSGIVTSFLGGSVGLAGRSLKPHGTLPYLEAVYPGVTATFDGHSLLQHWPSVPFNKGSYSCPLPGQYTTLVGSFGEPELGGRLLFAGEHCSVDYPGFMDGAVQSGNNAAKILLGRA